MTNAFTQTDSEHLNAANDMTWNSEQTENEPKSLTENIKEAAELAMQNMGFVYEETSGMYYDYNTGYYYNAVRKQKSHTFVDKRMIQSKHNERL